MDEPMAGSRMSDEQQFWEELAHLYDLRAAIFDEVIDGAFVSERLYPLEGEAFYDGWSWPLDEAALLLDAWKSAA